MEQQIRQFLKWCRKTLKPGDQVDRGFAEIFTEDTPKQPVAPSVFAGTGIVPAKIPDIYTDLISSLHKELSHLPFAGRSRVSWNTLISPSGQSVFKIVLTIVKSKILGEPSTDYWKDEYNDFDVCKRDLFRQDREAFYASEIKEIKADDPNISRDQLIERLAALGDMYYTTDGNASLREIFDREAQLAVRKFDWEQYKETSHFKG